MNDLEKHFQFFRENTIGNEQFFQTPYGKKKILYADWSASGRLYKLIEEKVLSQFGSICSEYAYRNEYYWKKYDMGLP